MPCPPFTTPNSLTASAHLDHTDSPLETQADSTSWIPLSMGLMNPLGMLSRFHACNLFKKAGLPLLSLILLAHVSANLFFFLIIDPSEVTANYLLGVGRADCTGPVAEVPLMGYANPEQVGSGLLMRLYSRAFIVADLDDSRRVVFVSADIGMVSQRLRLEVLKKLKSKYGELYRQDNVILSGTHTHSGPGGYFQYTLFWITGKGLIRPSLNAIVNGIVKSIDIAHQNMKRGRLFINRGTVENSQINRSPFSYLENPASERSRYSSNTDKEMVMLKMVDENGQELGLISWFAVHPVSMNNTNHLVNSDNVGYASYLFEQEKNKGMLPGEVRVLPSHFRNAKMCMAMGPGNDMFDSTRIIGQNIYLKARELYEKAYQEVTGPLSSAHQWVNMSDVSVELNATHTVKTCKPALGYSFAAGTIDGVGAFNFTQGNLGSRCQYGFIQMGRTWGIPQIDSNPQRHLRTSTAR
uniref:Neutral ceramidase n=1 Tax=Accipiter nisus TaxID=211598 RepID=A0A8B9M5S8_9AVES